MIPPRTTLGWCWRWMVACEYLDGELDQVRFMIGGRTDLSRNNAFGHITSLCPETFNPEGLPLTEATELSPEPNVTIRPRGQVI